MKLSVAVFALLSVALPLSNASPTGSTISSVIVTKITSIISSSTPGSTAPWTTSTGILTTPKPTPTTTSPALCMHYCLYTKTVSPTCTNIPNTTPCIINAIVVSTKTAYCPWCPYLSCVMPMRTTTVTGTCDTGIPCPHTVTTTASCPEKTWPTGYKITQG